MERLFISYAMAFNKENNRKGAVYKSIPPGANTGCSTFYPARNLSSRKSFETFRAKTFQNYPWSSYQNDIVR